MTQSRASAAAQAAWIALALLPAAGYVWLRLHADVEPTTVAPDEHFFVVSLALLLCLAVSVTGVRSALRSQSPRTFLVSLGSLSTAGFLSVHALATPGFVIEAGDEYLFLMSVSSSLAILFGAGFLAVSALPLPADSGPRLGAWQVPVFVGMALALLAWGIAALSFPESVEIEALEGRAFVNLTVVPVLALTGFAAVAYARRHLRTGLAIEGALAAGAVLMFEAQVVMYASEVWQWSWWLYHLLLLAAFTTMLSYPFTSGESKRIAAIAPERAA